MNTTTLVRRVLTLLAAVALAVGLGACRDEERNRPLSYDKGQYNGQKGSELSEDQLRALRQRNRAQAGGGI